MAASRTDMISTDGHELTHDEKLKQLAKILDSQCLRNSEQLRTFLRFVGHKAIDEPGAVVKETTIAFDVFGRSNDYDPRIDSAVRVHAGRLRAKLYEYYSTEGAQDPVLVELPKGHYSPSFAPKDARAPDESSPEAPPIPSASAEIQPEVEPRRWRRSGFSLALVAGLAALAVGFAGLSVWYRASVERRGSPSAAQTPPLSHVASQALGHFLHAPNPVLISYSNAVFEGSPVTGMRQARSTPPVAMVINDHYTGVGEVMAASMLSSLFTKAGRPFRVKRGLLLTLEDVKAENIIFLGSPKENLLLRDLPQEQHLVFDWNTASPENTIVDTKAGPGERRSYSISRVGSSTDQITEVYSLVSLVKGLGADNKILLLAGLTTIGTQAAAEYVTSPHYGEDLAGATPTGMARRIPDYYQVLLRVQVVRGIPVRTTYVFHRSLG
jgi:hypothetical protein